MEPFNIKIIAKLFTGKSFCTCMLRKLDLILSQRFRIQLFSSKTLRLDCVIFRYNYFHSNEQPRVNRKYKDFDKTSASTFTWCENKACSMRCLNAYSECLSNLIEI